MTRPHSAPREVQVFERYHKIDQNLEEKKQGTANYDGYHQTPIKHGGAIDHGRLKSSTKSSTKSSRKPEHETAVLVQTSTYEQIGLFSGPKTYEELYALISPLPERELYLGQDVKNRSVYLGPQGGVYRRTDKGNRKYDYPRVYAAILQAQKEYDRTDRVQEKIVSPTAKLDNLGNPQVGYTGRGAPVYRESGGGYYYYNSTNNQEYVKANAIKLSSTAIKQEKSTSSSNPCFYSLDKVVAHDESGRAIYKGPRGGKYYLTADNSKRYVSHLYPDL